MAQHGVMERGQVGMQEGLGLILAVLQSSWVTLCKSLNHFGPQFQYLKKRIVDQMAIKIIPSLSVIWLHDSRMRFFEAI